MKFQNPLVCKVPKIWHASDFILIFSRENNSRKGDNSAKKKNVVQLFSHKKSIRNFKTLACTVHKM